MTQARPEAHVCDPARVSEEDGGIRFFWHRALNGAPDPHSTGVISQSNSLFFSPEK